MLRTGLFRISCLGFRIYTFLVKVGAGRKVRAGQGMVMANSHRGPVSERGPANPRESATENTQPMAPHLFLYLTVKLLECSFP